jgi:hypothetical protein
MQVRCQHCGYMLTLSRDEVAAAIEELERTHAKHYPVTCHKCRHQVKVLAGDFMRRRPASTT